MRGVRKLRVAFVHPDLGLGGAERLIVDAALGLDSLGHTCTIYTPYLDRSRAFSQVTSGQVRSKVVWVPVPRSFFGRLHAICAAVRCALVALWVALVYRPDVAVVDIVTLPAVVLSFFGIPSLFYCHYPDVLLAKTLDSTPSSIWKRAYRWFVDILEAAALRGAHSIAVNSRFTGDAFSSAFPRARTPDIVYPCTTVQINADKCLKRNSESERFILSLNRYERKKNVTLAVETLAKMEPDDVKLIVAGGYDNRITENVDYYEELKRVADGHNLIERVTFLRNVSETERTHLLKKAECVLYTPAGEHFGIVPLEAMAVGTPVVAVDSGGPCETIQHGITGLLCKPKALEFAKAVDLILSDTDKAREMGNQGKILVASRFSRTNMARHFERLLLEIVT